VSLVAGVLDGVRVIEVSAFGFVPSSGAVLADLGADVIKVEPLLGDPMRTLPAFGMAPGTGGVTLQWEVFNRGKRSIALDLTRPECREVLLRLVETADVFLTSYLAPTRSRLGIDVDQIRARNSKIIYARGSGQGPRGAEADVGSFDILSFWYRNAIADAVSTPGTPAPPLPSPAFGDVLSGVTLAGGVTAALFRRQRTGRTSVVDVSLMSTGMWAMQIGVVASDQVDYETMRGPNRQVPGNPLVRQYLTSDGRLIALCMIDSDRYWPDLCGLLGIAHLAADARFVDAAARREHDAECVAVLANEFRAQPLAHWRALLSTQHGQWAVSQREHEVGEDPQALANGYIKTIDYGNGISQRVVAAPFQFDEQSPRLLPAPSLGEHTADLFVELELAEDEIAQLRRPGSA
jgi:crotonobetainyl-CoA:carnitine CoA-transferase CaiB-like acyl-CoA transferase